ncbi:3-isopropylmalate dehydratase large subunit [Achromobacter aloeverae]|uniref:3-isopropylmalate dehydratase large subunit n=1 Tax=Achromobacter aloeverae TaxID=1750518 RepID=A0A4Q1HP53_9BURK|nr:3-isopropylmalate dehydratase large subunit [Achromobacter aloeverae]RXN92597.1 3-isopropylmalate dehydratase large subunit [Achromobacter aloeverae]
MPSTIAEKILARHAGADEVQAGDIVVADVDFAMVHDARAPNAIRMVDKMGAQTLPYASRTAWVLDHYSPPPNLAAAQTHTAMRRFADEHGSPLYDIGDGICHQVLPEGGHLTCGDLVVGTDTHSVTYGAFNAFGTGVEGTDVTAVMKTGKVWLRVPETTRVELTGRLQPGVWAKDVTLHMLGRFGAEGLNYHAIEYVGDAVAAMEIDDRMTLANHAAELGAKAALLEADQKTLDWLAAHGARAPRPVKADADARYANRVTIDGADLAPQVARRHEVDDVVPVTQIDRQKIHFALIGTCTNGRLDDIRQAAAILRGRKLARGVRMIVTPASRKIYLEAAREGLIEILTAAGASFEAAGCGTCVGITNHLIPGDHEVAISSANRNFRGRLGNHEAEIWLGSAATVAASALTGYITDPRTVDGGLWRPAHA